MLFPFLRILYPTTFRQKGSNPIPVLVFLLFPLSLSNLYHDFASGFFRLDLFAHRSTVFLSISNLRYAILAGFCFTFSSYPHPDHDRFLFMRFMFVSLGFYNLDLNGLGSLKLVFLSVEIFLHVLLHKIRVDLWGVDSFSSLINVVIILINKTEKGS